MNINPKITPKIAIVGFKKIIIGYITFEAVVSLNKSTTPRILMMRYELRLFYRAHDA